MGYRGDLSERREEGEERKGVVRIEGRKRKREENEREEKKRKKKKQG